ncbi:Methylisocitrate lyase [Venturia nashicola]|uniref:Methylisocitrate lyase n=1 Tax=Venturia nashicola TaxID=86259 RepID=A0A4Z1NNH7_9PEZI|nr:Methylisocitrate lyase [Venturia nashicola]
MATFRTTLRSPIIPDDSSWTFTAAGLPGLQHTDAKGFIKLISVISSAAKQQIDLSFTKAPLNRAISGFPLDKLALISFADFRLRCPSESGDGATEPALPRQSTGYLVRLLTAGVTINGVTYNFYGHSNSQLKSRSCFLFAAPRSDIADIVNGLGDFSKIKSVAKKAKRIGLLFSSTKMGFDLPSERCEDIPDIQNKDYNFTDGCGLVSPGLVQQAARAAQIVFRNQKYLPSVIQIRYRGYKGVLTLEPNLTGKILVQFRDSMRKFKDVKDLKLAVVDYSKPYAFGYLNDEVILLLHALGISSDILLTKQHDHLAFLARVDALDAQTSFQYLSYCDQVELAERVLIEGVDVVGPQIRKLIRAEYDKLLNKRDEQKCRIMILKSRLMFGVCDPRGTLKEGECMVRVTLHGNGQSVALQGTEVIVTRNPCLHPGDIRKLKVVNCPDLAHLTDCIVFPTQGGRATADLMSGGDLDGDKFFVSWDSDIIPRSLSQAAEYPGGKEPINFGQITDDDRLKYFAGYTSASLGQVKNLFLDWARLKGPMSAECQQLNRLFSQCVDGNRIRFPDSLKDPPKPPADLPPFILDVLHAASREVIENRCKGLNILDGQTSEAVQALLCKDYLAFSEFELMKMTMKWCNKNEEEFTDHLQLFDLNALTDEEKIWTLARLPHSKELPGLLMNGLLQSSLVTPQELSRFKLDYQGLRWKRIFDGNTDRMGMFLDQMATVLESFHKKIIFIRVDDRLTLAIYVPTKLEPNQECQVDAAVRVFAFPHSQGGESVNYKVTPTKINYRLYFDGHSFQLYNNKRADTWIYLNRGPTNDTSIQNARSTGEFRRGKQMTLDDGRNFECRASVALNKISSSIQKHVGRVRTAGVPNAEIYVISNRDLKGLRTLDLWLEYVDTEKVHPLFEQEAREYTIPHMESTDWAALPEQYDRIARGGDMTALNKLDTGNELHSLLLWLLQQRQFTTILRVYDFFLGQSEAGAGSISVKECLQFLTEFLTRAPFASTRLFQSASWSQHRMDFGEMSPILVPKILRSIIISSTTMGPFTFSAFRQTLVEAKLLSMQSFTELVELVALTARSPDIALELLLECLEPEAPRLIIGRPAATHRFIKSLIGLAVDHVEEAAENQIPSSMLLQLTRGTDSNDSAVLEVQLRIDAPKTFVLRIGDHVRLSTASKPENAPMEPTVEIDGIVERSQKGSAAIRCLQKPPDYLAECSWQLLNCGSFVTCKAMIDAILTLHTDKEICCKPYQALIGLPFSLSQHRAESSKPALNKELNQSQNRAVTAAMSSFVSLLWGPPGTGKTRTVVEILELFISSTEKRVLVAAPTHNAVDNVLRKFVQVGAVERLKIKPLRVSTDVRKVADDVKAYTCDAMMGKDLNENHGARREAQKRIKSSRIIFTTCIGANLGLLRNENFAYVVIDEASQQTEPETLVPLVKGCEKVILVGDHVQLRATTQQHSKALDFDMSLFERLYQGPKRPDISKVMLDTQYRMHSSICNFSSSEFYDGKLQTAVLEESRPLAASSFPWPTSTDGKNSKRMVFLQCSGSEDLGSKSKSNRSQTLLCEKVCKALCTPKHPDHPDQQLQNQSIVVLTPYTRQIDLLKKSLPAFDICSIDGFQGREADIIVFVTVRSNQHREMGFLKDMRRLNVAVTRAKAGLIIIGDSATLEGGKDGESALVWKRLVGCCEGLDLEVLG